MELLLIRHGEAVDDAGPLGDEGRWLTAKGRKTTRKVARWLAADDARQPREIWTSPLVRAVQTAEIVASAARLTGEISAVSELSPAKALEGVLRRLSRHVGVGQLALVGHEPLLSSIAEALLGTALAPGALKKSGVVALSWTPRARGALRFVLRPKGLALVAKP